MGRGSSKAGIARMQSLQKDLTKAKTAETKALHEAQAARGAERGFQARIGETDEQTYDRLLETRRKTKEMNKKYEEAKAKREAIEKEIEKRKPKRDKNAPLF